MSKVELISGQPETNSIETIEYLSCCHRFVICIALCYHYEF